MEAVKQALACSSLNLVGVHCHIGSQIHEVTPFIRAAEVMVQFMADVRQETGHTLGELNLGGGYGIRYTDEDDPVPYAAYMEEVSEAIRASAAALRFPMPFILMEPGRSIVARRGPPFTPSGRSRKSRVSGPMCRSTAAWGTTPATSSTSPIRLPAGQPGGRTGRPGR